MSEGDSSKGRGRSNRRLRWAGVVSWIAGGLVFGAVVWIRYGHVMHPGWQWVGVSFAAMIGAAVWGVVELVRTGRERSWRAAGAWMVALVLPMVFCVMPLVYGLVTMKAMRRPVAERRLPIGRGWQELSGAMGAPLLDAAARIKYPRRAVGEHVVMIYRSAAEPDRDVAAMDAHVEQLSALLGQSCTAKVHWVRGKLCGVGGMYFQGMSFGSDSTKEGKPNELDRHEVAHFVIEHLAGPQARPQSMLQEGWAQTQMGVEPGRLASQALSAWAANPRLGPAALAGRAYYDSREAIVYSQGGGFADFLLRRYGGPRFFELYRACRERTFAEDCQRVLGTSLTELERLYDADLEQQAMLVPDREGLAKAPLRLVSDSGRPSTVLVWMDRKAFEKAEPAEDVEARVAFLEQYPAALARLRQMFATVSISAKTTFRATQDGKEVRSGEVMGEFAQDGKRWRARAAGATPEQIFISTPQRSVVFSATDKAGHYSTSEKLPSGVAVEEDYGNHARLLPYRVGGRDISELFSDSSFAIRDIVAVQVDGRDAVQVRYERIGNRERGHVTFEPRRAWAVLEFEKLETYTVGPERRQTNRFTYAAEDIDRPALAKWYRSSKTEERGRFSEEEAVVTSFSLERPEEGVFSGPGK